MRTAWIGCVGLAVSLLLAACVLPGSGAKAPVDPTAAADAPVAGPGDPRPKPRPGSAGAAASAASVAALKPPAAARTPDDQDDMLLQATAAQAEAPAAEPHPEPVLPDTLFQVPEPPPVPAALTGQAAQCSKKKGKFIRRGEGGTFVCVRPTRDANTRCNDSSDCEGLCFAKSRTCAPVTPIFGCYDALESGRVVNICTE